MLHVTPEYIVLVSNPAEIVVAEDESELALPPMIAATRLYCCRAYKSRVAATISPTAKSLRLSVQPALISEGLVCVEDSGKVTSFCGKGLTHYMI